MLTIPVLIQEAALVEPQPFVAVTQICPFALLAVITLVPCPAEKIVPAGIVQVYETAPAIGETLKPLPVVEIAPRFPTA